MIRKNKALFYFLLIIPLIFCMACGNSKNQLYGPAPDKIGFSSLQLGNTLDDMKKTEGEPDSQYPSVYGGTTYTYPRLYHAYDGVVKYMYDSADQLMSIAWTYEADSYEHLTEAYKDLVSALTALYGSTGETNNNGTVSGMTWRLQDCNLAISCAAADQTFVLQISYLSPKQQSD